MHIKNLWNASILPQQQKQSQLLRHDRKEQPRYNLKIF